MLEDENAELVRRIAARAEGSRAAEEALCRRFATRVRLYGLRHLRDEDRARDLVQAVLLAVIEAARSGRIEDPDRVDRFVLGTCRNIALRARAIEARTIPAEGSELDVLALAPAAEKIESAALTRCIHALEQRARRVVILSFHEEKSAEEIATALETTPGNVRVLRHRAVAQLRRCLDDHQEVDR